MAIHKAHRQDIRSLKRRNERWAKRRLVVEGVKCILELLKSPWEVERIYFTSDHEGSAALGSLQETSLGTEFASVSAKDMEMMSALKTAPGFLAVAQMPDPSPYAPGLWLYLDDINDPGNVGTLIRVADWFGLAGVVLSSATADPFGPKAVQSAMGSTFHVPLRIQNLKDLPEDWRMHVAGLDAGGKNLFARALSSLPTLLVIGSESHGMSGQVKASCHDILSIPGAGRAESLNASVAGAVAVSALMQQAVSMDQGS